MNFNEHNPRLGSEALLLTLWSRCQDATGRESLSAVSMATDLAFLAAIDLHQNQMDALDCYLDPPAYQSVSTALFDDIEMLIQVDLLNDEKQVGVSQEGKRLADAFWIEVGALPENHLISERLDAIVCEYGTLDRSSLHQRVEKIKHLKAWEDARSGQRKVSPALESVIAGAGRSCTETFFISLEWRTTLELCFSPAARDDLAAAMEDFQGGRFEQESGAARELLSV